MHLKLTKKSKCFEIGTTKALNGTTVQIVQINRTYMVARIFDNNYLYRYDLMGRMTGSWRTHRLSDTRRQDYERYEIPHVLEWAIKPNIKLVKFKAKIARSVKRYKIAGLR